MIFQMSAIKEPLEGELDEGGQKVQFAVIREINTRNVMYMINIINTAYI